MRLIDADALLEHAGVFEAKACARGCGKSILHLAKAWLWNEVDIAPTIDAVPVVRCSECKHLEKGDFMGGKTLDSMEFGGRCPFAKFSRYESDFCSRGERKGG